MILIGAWLILLGYGLAYAGVSRINGKQIGLRDAFSTQPTGSFTSQVGIKAAQGATAADQQVAITTAQESTIPNSVVGPR